MAEDREKKNPLLAAFLSAIVIGSGHFYLRIPIKALSYMALMATLIIAQVHADQAEHHVMIALLMSAFYFFQIYDAYQDAKSHSSVGGGAYVDEALPSKWVALSLVVAGILLQLSNLELIRLRLSDLVEYWPLLLIVLGLRMATKRQ